MRLPCDWLDERVFLPCEASGVPVWFVITREPVAWAAFHP